LLQARDTDEEDLAGVDMVWEMVRQSVMFGDRVLSHLMVRSGDAGAWWEGALAAPQHDWRRDHHMSLVRMPSVE
jgi:hypothetical protein